MPAGGKTSSSPWVRRGPDDRRGRRTRRFCAPARRVARPRVRPLAPASRSTATDSAVEVVKDVGAADDVCRRYHLERHRGYLAVGHTRMATESAVTSAHSHPFVACAGSVFGAQRIVLQPRNRPAPARGRRGAVRLRQRLRSCRPLSRGPAGAGGDDLEQATRWLLKDLDGFFTLRDHDCRLARRCPRPVRVQTGRRSRSRRVRRGRVRVPRRSLRSRASKRRRSSTRTPRRSTCGSR